VVSKTDAMTTAELDAIYAKVKNWGRWGAGDERGALNHLTDAHRAHAATLVRDGVTVSLAHDLPVRPFGRDPVSRTSPHAGVGRLPRFDWRARL
jgi:hypothetical protein